jgi:hypothetical protein
MSGPRPNPINTEQYFKWLWKKFKATHFYADDKTIAGEFFWEAIKWSEHKSGLAELGIEKTGDHLQQAINRLAAVVAPGETGLTLDDLVTRIEKGK